MRRTFLLLLPLLLAACGKAPPVVWCADVRATMRLDASGSTLAVDGDRLTLGLPAAAGCPITLCWRSFLESNPVQAPLELHRADNCTTRGPATLEFDLAPLKSAWRDAYHRESGTLTLALGTERADYTF